LPCPNAPPYSAACGRLQRKNAVSIKFRRQGHFPKRIEIPFARRGGSGNLNSRDKWISPVTAALCRNREEDHGKTTVPVVRLTEVFRQAAQSKIITTAHAINSGHLPDLGKPDAEADFYFVPAADPEQAVLRIVELVAKRIPQRFGFDPIKDIRKRSLAPTFCLSV
jgi:hypothetical protein